MKIYSSQKRTSKSIADFIGKKDIWVRGKIISTSCYINFVSAGHNDKSMYPDTYTVRFVPLCYLDENDSVCHCTQNEYETYITHKTIIPAIKVALHKPIDILTTSELFEVEE